MAIKTETLLLLGVIIFAVVYLGKPSDVTPTTNGAIDLCRLIESEASFTGQTMFLAGTTLTAEWARVIKINGDGTIKDKGQISMDSGTTDTKPRAPYKIYLGENSSTYYTQAKDYTAPCEDATDDVVGVLCTIDTTPTLTAFDEYGRPQSGTANNVTMAASDVKDVTVRVKVSADECYGNPYATGKNAICAKYITNASGYQSVKGNTGSQVVPYTIASNNATTKYAIDCYELDLLKDTEYQDVTFTITADDSFSAIDATSDLSDIVILINDMAFDLDADTLDEIWGFEDEDRTELGDTTLDASVVIQIDD